MHQGSNPQIKQQEPPPVRPGRGWLLHLAGLGLLQASRTAQDVLPGGWVTDVVVQVTGAGGALSIGLGVMLSRQRRGPRK